MWCPTAAMHVCVYPLLVRVGAQGWGAAGQLAGCTVHYERRAWKGCPAHIAGHILGTTEPDSLNQVWVSIHCGRGCIAG